MFGLRICLRYREETYTMYTVKNKHDFAEFELSEMADAFKLCDTLGDGITVVSIIAVLNTESFYACEQLFTCVQRASMMPTKMAAAQVPRFPAYTAGIITVPQMMEVMRKVGCGASDEDFVKILNKTDPEGKGVFDFQDFLDLMINFRQGTEFTGCFKLSGNVYLETKVRE